MTYFDNAATTRRKPDCVRDAVLAALSGMGNAGRGAGESSLGASRIIYEAREELCNLFHAPSPSQIAFTSNSTEALNTAIFGLISPGDHVITTVMEHNSVLRPLFLQEKRGVSLSIIGTDEYGRLKMDDLAAAFRPDTKAVVCTHASNLTGNSNDLAAIGSLCRVHGARLIVDASQSAGVFPINMEEMGIDILCFTGHKSLFGPQGTGGIALAGDVKLRPLKVGGSGIKSYDREHPSEMPTALEAGTLNAHGIAGLLAGVRFIREITPEAIHEKESALALAFYEGIRNLPNIKVYGDIVLDGHAPRAPIVPINIGDYDSARVSDALLTDYGIETRAGGHCAPLMHRALGTEEQGLVRFSFSWFNTEEEVQLGIDAVRELASDS